jgi:hypothetical protein
MYEEIAKANRLVSDENLCSETFDFVFKAKKIIFTFGEDGVVMLRTTLHLKIFIRGGKYCAIHRR